MLKEITHAIDVYLADKRREGIPFGASAKKFGMTYGTLMKRQSRPESYRLDEVITIAKELKVDPLDLLGGKYR